MFHGLVVPSDFVPVQPGDGERAVYATDRNAVLVRDQLQHLLREVELGATWVEPTVATVVRGMASGLVTIYPHAGSVRDLDGSALFPTARPDETVVRFSAT